MIEPRGAGSSAAPNLQLWTRALWFAMVTALSQIVLGRIAQISVHRITAFGRDFVWMSVAADVIVFVAAAAALQVVASAVRRPLSSRVALATFLFLFLLGPALIVPRLSRVAALVLCAGLAIQGARILLAQLSLFDGLIRWTFWPLATACMIAGLAVRFAPDVAARAREASLPPAAGGSPNVVLVVLDTVRAQNLGLYGYGRQTSPRLDRFAKTGVTFDRAFSTSPWTLPSHGTLFTGQFPGALSADWLTPLDGTYTTVAELFARRGYVTSGFVGNLIYCTAQTGLNRGFTRFSDYVIRPGTLVASSWLMRPIVESLRESDAETNPLLAKRASEVNAEFAAWLVSRPQRPFFAFLNYFDAHRPYLPPPPYDTRFGEGGKPPELSRRRSWSKQEIQRSMDAYDGEVAYVDNELGRLLDILDGEHVLDNTIVVVTSDHGEQFGEHGLFDHANSLYRQLLQVPLVISFRGRVPAGARVHDPVSLADLPATIQQLAGVNGTAERLPGRSLDEYWRSPSDAQPSPRALIAQVSKGVNLPEWLPVAKGPMASVIVGGMHYIRHSSGREELYDIDRDIAEADDLSDRAESHEALERSRRALDTLLKSGPSSGDAAWDSGDPPRALQARRSPRSF